MNTLAWPQPGHLFNRRFCITKSHAQQRGVPVQHAACRGGFWLLQDKAFGVDEHVCMPEADEMYQNRVKSLREHAPVSSTEWHTWSSSGMAA